MPLLMRQLGKRLARLGTGVVIQFEGCIILSSGVMGEVFGAKS